MQKSIDEVQQIIRVFNLRIGRQVLECIRWNEHYHLFSTEKNTTLAKGTKSELYTIVKCMLDALDFVTPKV